MEVMGGDQGLDWPLLKVVGREERGCGFDLFEVSYV